MKIEAMTDKGLVRENNEDAYWFDTDLQAIAIADGIGGHKGGEVASRLAVQDFGTWCERTLSPRRASIFSTAAYCEIIPAIDQRVAKAGSDHIDLRGMGTTLVGALFHNDCLHVTHIGDSRMALISWIDGTLKWMTKDDNMAELMVARGELTPEEARKSNYRHHLTACIGGGGDGHITEVHYQQMAWPQDDLLLLCTDGLLDNTKDSEIVDCCISSRPEHLEAACDNLVELANSKGGRDNCTVILASKE